MAKNITTLKVRKRSFLQTVAEMIGRVQPVNDWLKRNSLIWELYSASPTVDYSKVNYTLTRAIFYASEVKDSLTNKSYGSEFLFGAVFGKPIVNAAAAFAFAKPPDIEITIPEETQIGEQEDDTSGEEYTQNFINDWLSEKWSYIFKSTRNSLRDGDQYIFLSDDLVPTILPPESVEIVDDKMTGELIGYDVTTYVEETDDNGNTSTVKFVEKYRKTSPFRQLFRFDTKGSKEGKVMEEDLSEEGEEDEERKLPIIGFHNERDARERYGNSEYQNCYYLMANYHAVLENAVKNNIYNSNATPVISGIDDITKWVEANGVKNDSGEYEVKWDANKLLIGGKDFDAKVVSGVQNADQADKLLNLLFWLICQTSETPEFVMGTAVSSSKASVEEQMPVVIRKAERKRGEYTEYFRELIALILDKGNKIDPEVLPSVDFMISWPSIIDDDLKVNIDIVKALSEEGCITDRTKLMLLNIGKYVSSIDDEIEKAREERTEKSLQAGEYGESSIYSKLNQGEELTPEEEEIATKEV